MPAGRVSSFRYLVPLGVLSLLVTTGCESARAPEAPGRVETGFLDRTLALDGKSYPYQVYVPAEYRPDTPLPLIVDLHGNGMQGTDGLRPTALGLANLIRSDRSRFPCLVLFPQAPPDTLWLQRQLQDVVLAELQIVREQFRADPSRVYLSGFSMGGTGAYRLAFNAPRRFTALLVVAGRVVPGEEYGAALREIDRRDNRFVGAGDSYAALAAGIKDLPIAIVHGAADETVPVTESRALVAALRQAGAEVRYEEYAETSHLAAAERAYGHPALFEWLLSRRRADH